MNKKSVFFLTFGCQMNSYDSDRAFAILAKTGYGKTDNPQIADLLVVNTCAVREHAEERAMSRIRELAGIKKRGARLVVMGCMAKRLGKGLSDQIEKVDWVIGPDQIGLLEAWAQEPDARCLGETKTDPENATAPDSAGKVSVYVAIAQGCDNHCSYCIVPLVRGPERSRALPVIVEEASRAVGLGAREIFLLGQNVNSYRHGDSDFCGLLRSLQEIPGEFRIRFLTSHPKDLSKDLAKTMRDCPKVCEHFHLPLQAGSDAVLARMNRGYTGAQYLEKVAWLREHIPGISLTTDIIAGFPGETEGDFKKTVELMQQVEFDDAFTYRYSPRPGTPAEKWPDTVLDEEKAARLEELILLQKNAKARKQASLIGRTFRVLFEKPASRDPGQWWGKTRCDRPVVAQGAGLFPGAEKNIRIVGTTGATLIGEIVP